MKKIGYREMLRDRCPSIVNYSLKWCKAKEKWIDHVYSNFINVYIDKDQRNNATRIALGIEDHKHPHFDFDKTINWDDLTNEDANYWKRVSAWVKWFMVNYSYVKNTYDISKKMGKDYFDIEVKIIHEHLSWLLPSKDCTSEEKEAKYDYVDKLAEYLIECIENDNK